MKWIDIFGFCYGCFLVVVYDFFGENGGFVWFCWCECGVEVKVKLLNLWSGLICLCGCFVSEWVLVFGLNREFVRKCVVKVIVYGYSCWGLKILEYRIWLGMKCRCYDEKYKDFFNWGGCGIKVCECWNELFEVFFKDMGFWFVGRYSIDWIDLDGDYCFENCWWVMI